MLHFAILYSTGKAVGIGYWSNRYTCESTMYLPAKSSCNKLTPKKTDQAHRYLLCLGNELLVTEHRR